MFSLSSIKSDVINRVKAMGFTTIYVGTEDNSPPFAYTIGLCAKARQQREVIVVGLPKDVAIRVLNIVGRRLINGEEMPLGVDIDQVLERYRVRFAAVSHESFAKYGLLASWYSREILKRDGYPQALQLLWPDQFGLLPGSRGFTAKDSQPLL